MKNIAYRTFKSDETWSNVKRKTWMFYFEGEDEPVIKQ